MAVTYMTRQQRAVLDCIAAFPGGSCTAVELTDKLHESGQTVGLTTVYRQLDRLSQQGQVHKIVTDEGAHYQYCDAHGDCFLLKCEKCGTIVHMDCSHLGELYSHIMQEHHFTINPRKTLFYGLCAGCSREGQT